jgi:NAD(P)-dependent dehydrogenase (short-subunit alcohol dehydrogenase family)
LPQEKKMSKQLENKRVLVTGAASGMGRAMAVAMAGEGAIVAVHARDRQKSAETVQEIARRGGKAHPVEADLTNSAETAAMCAAAVKALGGMDIIVNNAGVADYGRVTDMPESTWDWIVDTNLKAPFVVLKHCLPAMLAQGAGGSVIFNASTNGKTADAEWSAYNASKHGVIGLMRCLAAELGPQQIRVNAICPGWIETNMARDIFQKLADQQKRPFEDVYQEGMRFNMMKALIPAEAVADAAVFLASDRGRYITGQTINVCAGLCYW